MAAQQQPDLNTISSGASATLVKNGQTLLSNKTNASNHSIQAHIEAARKKVQHIQNTPPATNNNFNYTANSIPEDIAGESSVFEV